MIRQYGFGLLLLPLCAYFAAGIEDYNATGWIGFLVHSLNLLPHEAGDVADLDQLRVDPVVDTQVNLPA